MNNKQHPLSTTNTKRVLKVVATPTMNLHSIFTCLLVFAASFATSEAFVGGLKARAKQNLLETVESGASNDEVLKAVREVEKFSVLGGADLKNPLLAGNWLMVW